jgi:hypothetical protein
MAITGQLGPVVYQGYFLLLTALTAKVESLLLKALKNREAAPMPTRLAMRYRTSTSVGSKLRAEFRISEEALG